MDLVNSYINQGRFGKFVTGFLESEYERRKQDAEKDYEWKLWTMYIHSYTDKSYGEWKNEIQENATSGRKANKDDDLTDDGIKAIFSRLFPSK
jgi:hypothetical protein